MTAPDHCLAIPYFSNSLHYAQRLYKLAGFVWLDSGPDRSYGGTHDILTAIPDTKQTTHQPQEALQWQQQQLQRFPVTTAPALPFTGGIIGRVEYPTALPHHSKANLAPPAIHLAVYTWALIQNHEQQCSYLYFSHCCPSAIRAEVQACLKAPACPLKGFSCSPFTAFTPKPHYLQKVQRVLQYIQAGDAYQVNLSQAFSAQFSGCPFSAYVALRQASPSPFGAYMPTESGAILSLSPERFIGIQHKQAITQPIKGTMPRSNNPEQDFHFAQALKNSAKNRAENLMIVDLLRNDFSQNCQPYSVQTPDLFSLKSFANVHHLVSTVTGQLKDSVNAWQFFYDCFPGGSITGAPKKRAMEIIAELESSPRSIYCGSLFYWSSHGPFDSSITIRTLQISHNQLLIWGGGGIVADSQPEDEYAESCQKIALLQQALLNPTLQQR